MSVPQHVGATPSTVIQTFGLHCASESQSAPGVRLVGAVGNGGSFESVGVGDDHVGVGEGRLIRRLLTIDSKEVSAILELVGEDKAEDSSMIPLADRKGDVLGVCE